MAPTSSAPTGGSTERTTRLDVWRDLIREHFVALDIAAERADPFDGAVHSSTLGHLDVATVDSTAQVCRRTPGLVRRDSQAYFQVGLLTRGEARLEQDGRAAAIGPGDFAVYETDRPFCWDLHGDWQLYVYTWARPTIALGQVESQQLTARTLDGTSGLGGIVGWMLRNLMTAPPALSSAGATRLADEVGELVTTVATECVRIDPPGPGADLLRRIDAYIAEHLADPDLDPAGIARAHFLSTRQLHRLFAQRGTTVTQHIRDQRLDRCRQELANPYAVTHPIAEIGRRWGFSDPATFSRTFRSAFGTTPTRYRLEHRPTP